MSKTVSWKYFFTPCKSIRQTHKEGPAELCEVVYIFRGGGRKEKNKVQNAGLGK
jgi:hypothetical protein